MRTRVVVGRGSVGQQYDYIAKGRCSSVVIDTNVLKDELNIKSSKLILSIRDSIMVKALRAGRNVFILGDHSLIEQLERIEEVLNAQGQIDQAEYNWKVRDF